MTKYLAIALLVLAIFALTACSSAGQELVGPLWLLTELNGDPLIATTSISAEFDEEGKVGGSAGCNRYNTAYTVDGDEITIDEPMAMTMMACPEPIMDQEVAYAEALGNAVTFEIVEDELTLFDSNSEVLAKFEALDQSLEGTSWEVISYNNGKGGVTSLIIGTEITANFEEDDTLTGNASCNNYTASYEIEDDTISIGPAAATEMACQEPEGIMEQEGQYLAALETAATYKITGIDMEMRTEEGSLVATFKRESIP